MKNKPAAELDRWIAAAHWEMAAARASGEWRSDYPQTRTHPNTRVTVREQVTWDASIPLQTGPTPPPSPHAVGFVIPLGVVRAGRRRRKKAA